LNFFGDFFLWEEGRRGGKRTRRMGEGMRGEGRLRERRERLLIFFFTWLNIFSAPNPARDTGS
jgi:hypothetical protein